MQDVKNCRKFLRQFLTDLRRFPFRYETTF